MRQEEPMNRTGAIDHYLTEIPLFSACSKRELRTVSSLTTGVAVPAGEVLTSQGQPGREFVVILEGKATVTIDGTLIATLGPGDFFGEIALLDGGPRTATVTAVSDLACKVMSHGEFTKMLDGAPTMARKLLVGVAARLRDADVRLTR
jgi:CRP/FNR family transcriptional regulator, cyclic AMP receptor protein